MTQPQYTEISARHAWFGATEARAESPICERKRTITPVVAKRGRGTDGHLYICGLKVRDNGSSATSFRFLPSPCPLCGFSTIIPSKTPKIRRLFRISSHKHINTKKPPHKQICAEAINGQITWLIFVNFYFITFAEEIVPSV